MSQTLSRESHHSPGFNPEDKEPAAAAAKLGGILDVVYMATVSPSGKEHFLKVMDSSPIDLKKPGNNDVGICTCKSKNRGKMETDPMQEMDPKNQH